LFKLIKNRYFLEIMTLSGFVLFFCRYPYSPAPEPAIVVSGQGGSEGKARVFIINGHAQICNPSVSLDTVHFPGCMLWLNFSGDLQITVPDSLQDYSAERSRQHDRLSIVDTSNTLRWYMTRKELGADALEEIQDPEWSAHPEYIVSLLSFEAKQKWGCYVIHPLSRNKLLLCKEGLSATSTPHIWIDPEAQTGNEPLEVSYDENGLADRVAVQTFFGTSNVKFVVGKQKNWILSLYYIDFSSEDKGLIPLQRPAGKDGWQCESPLISPDGNWIVFNVYKRTTYYETYIQELVPGSVPILLKEGASDPHWWRHPGDESMLYVVYQEVPGDNLVYGDFKDESFQNTAELGVTKRQMIRLFPGAPSGAVSLSRSGLEETIVSLPTKGGLSPDGRYLCTGYDRAFMVGLP
jgi:hypothetical protein